MFAFRTIFNFSLTFLSSYSIKMPVSLYVISFSLLLYLQNGFYSFFPYAMRLPLYVYTKEAMKRLHIGQILLNCARISREKGLLAMEFCLEQEVYLQNGFYSFFPYAMRLPL